MTKLVLLVVLCLVLLLVMVDIIKVLVLPTFLSIKLIICLMIVIGYFGHIGLVAQHPPWHNLGVIAQNPPFFY